MAVLLLGETHGQELRVFLTVGLIIVAAIGFGLLVLVHELGHFLVAKALKVRVDAFSIGFGPHIGKRWGETEYRLSLIPWGGYVKLAGEERKGDRPPAPREFYGRPPWQRAAVFAAGSVMNAILGLVAFIVAFAVGVPTTPPVVGEVVPGSPAWRAGVREDDRIVSVGHLRRSLDFSDVQVASLLGSPDQPIPLVVDRRGQRLHFQIAPEFDEIWGRLSLGLGAKQSLRIAAFAVYDRSTPRIVEHPESLAPESEAFSPGIQSGLNVGDELVEANGQELRNPRQFIDIVTKSEGKPIHVKYRREGTLCETDVKPIAKGDWLIGVTYGSTTIKAVRTGSWAEQLGLGEGDTIIAVNDRAVAAFSQLEAALAGASGDVSFTVKGKAPRVVRVRREDAQNISDAITFGPQSVVSSFIPGFPAEHAGIEPGDKILEIGGKSVQDKAARKEQMTRKEGAPLLVLWEHEGVVKSERITPQRLWGVGLAFGQPEETTKLDLWSACVVGSRKAFRWIPRIYMSFKGLLTGTIPSRQIQGPVSIAIYTYESAKRGGGTLAYFLAFISLNLALLNLLPIPVLDGGHLFFTLIEKLKGSPVSERAQTIASYIGLVLLVALMLYATFNDARAILFGIGS
jgi:regulator of sigma E protease